MQLVVTGACTALGQAVLRAIARRGQLCNALGVPAPVQRIIAVDRVQPAQLFVDARIEYVRGDYEQPRFLARMMGVVTDSVFHLAALGCTDDAAVDAAVDGAAKPGFAGAAMDREAAFSDLDNALLRSLDTTRALLDACGFQTAVPRIVFASTQAVRSEAGALPASTQAVCAALCELVLAESARRGLVDTRCVRLPGVVALDAAAEALVEAHEQEALQPPAARLIDFSERHGSAR